MGFKACSAILVAALFGPAAGALAQESSQNAPPATPEQTAPPAQDSSTPPPSDATQTPPADTAAPAEPKPAPQPEAKAADEEQSAKSGTKLEEVVVTANKRSQPLQEVPMSISAVLGKDLEKNGAKSFTDYAQTVPALNFGYFGEGRTRISLRGLQAPTGVDTVAVLVDGVSVSGGYGGGVPDDELFDIDRVEILRGPQGTLYGEGAVGGAIKMLTNPANLYTSLSKVQGGFDINDAGAKGNDLNGMINVPIVEGELGMRIVGFKRHHDGYLTVREPDAMNPPGLHSYSSKNIVATNANPIDVDGGRVTFDWKYSDDLTFSAKYKSERREQGVGPAESPGLEQRYGPYNVTQGLSALNNTFENNGQTQATFLVNWATAWGSFESVTGVMDIKDDLDAPFFLPLDAGTLAGGQPTGQNVYTMLDIRVLNDSSRTSQEFRFSSLPDGPFTFGGDLNWTTGVFFKTFRRIAHETGVASPDLNSTKLVSADVEWYSTEYALYSQGEYALTKKLSALLGVRYYHSDLDDIAYAGTTTDGQHRTPSFSDVSPKATLSYHLSDDALLYTTVAKGFRGGGNNFATTSTTGGSAPIPPDYAPDELWSYEVGANSTWFDGRMTANGAIFDAVWKNLQNDQVFYRSDGSIERGTVNAGKAHARGLEFETTTLLPSDLTWTLGGAYLDAALDVSNIGGDGSTVIPAGTPLENQPHWAGSTSLSHLYGFAGGWGLTSAVTWTYRGPTIADHQFPSSSISKSYQLLDFRVGLRGVQEAWYVDAFCKNILNQRASSFSFQKQPTRDLDTDLPLPWRTFGMRVNYNF